MGKKDKQSTKRRKKDIAAPDGAIAGSVIQTARALRNRFTRDLAAHGLYAGQDGVILALADAPAKTPSEIAAEIGVRAPTVTKTINRLIAQGFVLKRASDADGRKADISLTEAGMKTVESIRHAIRQTELVMLGEFSGKEARSLAKLLRRAERNLGADQDKGNVIADIG